MQRALIFCISMLAISGSAAADDAAAPLPEKSSEAKTEATPKPPSDPAPAKPQGDVHMSGMSVLGNDDSPKSLALVPWKTSQLGDAPSLSKLLDDSTQPVDKDVFMRELAYYEIKTDSK